MGNRTGNKILAIGGGKGGVGKSVLSIGISVSLAKKGNRVVLADLDLGAANLHTYLGIMGRTPSIADFILRRKPDLEEILVETEIENLRLISGAEFVPGMANPAHWMKLKMIRHLRNLDADYVVIDLGAGVHFNTLDFFGIADRGIVITAPEPGAVMNAYGFIKAALFRKLQSVFRRHSVIGPLIEHEAKKGEKDGRLSLEWLKGQIELGAPEMIPILKEIEESFAPALIINRVPEGHTHVLVKNLISLCMEKLGIQIEYIGNLPDVKEMPFYLLNIPKLFEKDMGKPYFDAVEKAVSRLLSPLQSAEPSMARIKKDFTDEEIEKIISFIDTLDDSIFDNTNKEVWKLRMFFKPEKVISFLEGKGITHELFYA